MKIKTLSKIFILVATLCICSIAFAQEVKPDEQPPQQSQLTVDSKIALLRHLGLAREQIQQIRRINAERKPLLDAAQQRLREATKRLDDAIYADNLAEAEFHERLKNVQQAQSEVSRIRFANELAIRRVLNPEQLVKFRDLRQRFETAQQNIQNNRRERTLNRQNAIDPVRRPIQNNDQNLRRVIRQRPGPQIRQPLPTRPQ